MTRGALTQMTIWVWPNGRWTHKHNDSELCETGPGGGRTKRATA